jgi:hypothetical protein
MNVPYNTGKVLIGSNYHPDRRAEIDGDMEHLQTALIGDVAEIKRRKIASVVYVGALVATLFGAFIFH